MLVGSISFYWHTIRHLKPVQILGRFWFRLYKPRPRKLLRVTRREAEGIWQLCPRQRTQLEPNKFSFLNVTRNVRFPLGWSDSEVPMLWLYNLHYFDDLVADDPQSRLNWHITLIRLWIQQNPPAQGIGWDPYPTSLRIVNWIKWSLAQPSVDSDILDSLTTQSDWLSRRLEFHIQGNHLWANAKALTFAGLFFDHVASDRWLEEGAKLLELELAEQVLFDGGHYERSPMYHSIILEDVLDILQISKLFRDAMPRKLEEALESAAIRMFAWLAPLTHPDGEIAFFNDAAVGIAPNLAALQSYSNTFLAVPASVKTKKLQLLEDSGYVRGEIGDAVLICDVAKLGPDHQPGHGHADTLSFELSLFGQRLFINSGIDRYEEGEERLWQRGTAAHNTVEIDGQNSSEVWKSFRVARRAIPTLKSVEAGSEVVRVKAQHDGYKRLAGDVVHLRSWSLSTNRLLLEDLIEGKFLDAIGRLYLHPEIGITQFHPHGCELLVAGQCVSLSVRGASLTVSDSSFHPEFGLSVDNHCLQFSFEKETCEIEVSW